MRLITTLLVLTHISLIAFGCFLFSEGSQAFGLLIIAINASTLPTSMKNLMDAY